MLPGTAPRTRIGGVRHLLALALSLLCVAASVARADAVLSVEPGVDHYELGGRFEILEDPSRALRFEDVGDASLAAGWQPSRSEVPSFGFTHSAYWFRIQLHNPGDQPIDRVLEVWHAGLEGIDAYVTQPGAPTAVVRSGAGRPFADRPIPHRNFLLPLRIPPGGSVGVTLRVTSDLVVGVPVALWAAPALIETEHRALLGDGIFAGILLLLAFYAFVLYANVRQPRYLLCGLYLIGYVALRADTLGVGYQDLWPRSPWLQAHLEPFLINALVLLDSLLTRDFLALRRHRPRLDRCFLWLAGAGGAAAAASLVAGLGVMTQIGLTLVLVTTVAIFAAGVSVWRREPRIAPYFLLARTSFLVGVVLLCLSALAVLPTNWLTANGMQLGMVGEAILLSFALAARVREERRGNLDAQRATLITERLLRQAQETMHRTERLTNERLEAQVRRRTGELNAALEKLAVANTRLEQHAVIDVLTNIPNHRFLRERFEKELRRARRSGSPLSFVLFDVDEFKQVNDRFGHLAGDECLRRTAEALAASARRPGDVVARYGGDEFAVLLPETKPEGAVVVAHRMRMAVEALQMKHEGRRIHVTVSAGVVGGIPTERSTPNTLIAAADRALYQVKGGGRNDVASVDAT